MAYLWKLTFEPLYPVCEGELIFFTEEGSNDAAKQAIQELENCQYYLGDSNKGTELTYLGEFTPDVDSEFHFNIISYQNGDY